jgi:predicted TIM-barrel fold metal-dependent hydrolase
LSGPIDVQGHYMPPAHLDSLTIAVDGDPAFARSAGIVASLGRNGSPVASLGEQRVALLDAAGIDVQVISVLPPGVVFGPEAGRAELAATANDGLIEAASEHPARFRVLVTLPLPDVDASLAEIDRVGSHPLVRGVCINADSTDWTLDEPRFDALYLRLAERGLLCALHPCVEDLPNAYNAYGLASSAGAMVSTTLTGLRLILSGMLDRVPGLDLVIPHLGGTIPYMTQRVMDLNGRGDAELDLSEYLRTRIWTDSCSSWHPALQCAIDTFGPDRIMLASDFPFRGPLEACVRDIETAEIPAETRHAILEGTALRWFAA